MTEYYDYIGKSVPRSDARGKLTGTALYAADVSCTPMLHLKILRSNRPHARILRIQTERAKRHPRVAAVFTYKDIPGENLLRRGQQIFCDRKVRHLGDPVAMVAAETPEAAQAGVSLIEVDYEDLPGMFSPEEALLEDAAKIHETGNVFMERSLRKGEPERGLRDAAVVITNTYRTQMVEHAYLEPEAGVASYTGKQLTVWMPSKYAHADRKEIAAVLGIPVDGIRIINACIGGSFGDKTSLSPGYYAAFASFKTGRPAKLCYTRQESFLASTKRHPFTIRYTTGAGKDGKICAVHVEITADVGAYAASSSSVLVKSLIHAAGPYDIPNIHLRIRGVYTNNPVAASMRGLGVPQVAFAHESQIDILAQTLGLDSFAIRLINALKKDSLTATGQRLGESVGLEETLHRVKNEILLRGVPDNIPAKRYAWGIASAYYGIGNAGRPSPGKAVIEATASGEIILSVGCGDVGQGSSTVLPQIAAEILTCTMDNICIIANDTDSCPDSGPTVASRVTYVVGRAVQIAAQKLKALLQEAAASLLNSAPDDLQLKRGFFSLIQSPRQKISLAEAAETLARQGTPPKVEGTYDPEVTPLDPETMQGSPMATYAFATQGALVSLDVDSGEIEVLSIVASHDVGRAINPDAVAGQIEGAVSMGLGFSLSEEVVLKGGKVVNPSLSDYLIPTALDIPETIFLPVEAAEPTGPFGAKGVGEPALIPTCPAIVNAVSAAAGARPKMLPVTPEAMWRILHHIH